MFDELTCDSLSRGRLEPWSSQEAVEAGADVGAEEGTLFMKPTPVAWVASACCRAACKYYWVVALRVRCEKYQLFRVASV